MIKCEYIDHMGDDLRVVNAARVSMNKESEWVETCECGIVRDKWHFNEWPGCGADQRDCHRRITKSLPEKDEKLIKYLATNNHWTPASHCMITVRETVPIFVARQRFKHTVGFTYSEISRRYVDDPPEFYIPDNWRKRAENVKQGSSDETLDLIDWGQEKISLKEEYKWHLTECYDLYDMFIKCGVAPEQARMVLPQSMMTSYYCTGSLAAFARAYNLRSDNHAQKEIRDLADQWNEIIGKLFPISWKELTNV